jgi:hypothetical protein
MKTYHVSISHEVEFHDCIEVQADTEEEAIARAVSLFQEKPEQSILHDVIIHEVEEVPQG